MRRGVTRRDAGRPPLLDLDLESPRVTMKLSDRWYDRFCTLYPCTTTCTMLALELAASGVVPIGSERGWLDRLNALHPATGKFDAIAHYSRLERAHRESEARGQSSDAKVRCDPKFVGMTLPARIPMPDALREVLGEAGAGKRPCSPTRRKVIG